MSNDNNAPITPQDEPEPSYEQLLAKITHPKQRAFLENYHKFGEITATANAVGTSRFAVWHWQQNGGELFKNAFNALKKEYDAHLLLQHERNLDNIAFDPEAASQSRVLASIFITKALAPDKYREKVATIPFTGNIKLELSVPRPNYGIIDVAPPTVKQLKEGRDATK